MIDIKDTAALRAAFGNWPSGVGVVSTFDETGRHRCMTMSSFDSVSLDPPLCLYCLENSARRYGVLSGASQYAVNILANDQAHVAVMFSKSDTDDDWNKVGYSIKGDLSLPILNGIKGFFECEKHSEHIAGDHTIIIGKIISYEIVPDKKPLLLLNGFVDLNKKT